AQCPDRILAHLMQLAKKADATLRTALGGDATHLIINNGKESGQEIPHLHMHIIPRFKDDNKNIHLAKEPYQEGEMAFYGNLLEF
ncbi:MAG: HIT domain-containing protein, partial [Spirochaetia bacterium]|nr:HIT domain-containing protein [Spirochaetia bacterium]